MNIREAMQALLDGKKLTFENDFRDRGEKYISLNEHGFLNWENGKSAALGSHDWQVYEEPNPHTKGTFAWAREEAKRGNLVKRQIYGYGYTAAYFEPNAHWSVESFEATDWTVVG